MNVHYTGTAVEILMEETDVQFEGGDNRWGGHLQ